MSKTIEKLKSYVPYNEQEEVDKQFFIDCERKEQILTRDNTLCHLVSSAVILNKTRDKMLAIYHNIYKTWAWVGGHADGDDDMLYVAIKEAKEETSLEEFKVLLNEPIAIDSISVDSHYRRGKFIPAHTHLNYAYVFEADENAVVHIKEDENSNIAWLTLDELIEKSCERKMYPIYRKIFEKIKKLGL